jgi:hypothetical protein
LIILAKKVIVCIDTLLYTHGCTDVLIPLAMSQAGTFQKLENIPFHRPTQKITNMDFGKHKREADYAENITPGYSIPRTKDSIKKILKEVSLPVDGTLSCSVRPVNGITISVETLQELMNGTQFEELLFGRNPTDHERKQCIEKHGGSEADNRRLIEFARKRADRDFAREICHGNTSTRFDTKGNQERQTISRWALDS